MSDKNKELEKLIDLSFTDGFISDKEREVLRTKAQKIGVNPDEVDVILDARIYELNNANKPAEATKCPDCGSDLEDDGECPQCIENPNTDEDLNDQREKMYYDLYATDESKKELIKNFGKAIQNEFERKPGIGDSLDKIAKKINYKWKNNKDVNALTAKTLDETKKAISLKKRNRIFRTIIALIFICISIYGIWFWRPSLSYSTGYENIDKALDDGKISQAWALYKDLPADEQLEGTYAVINVMHTDSLLNAENYELALERANLQPILEKDSGLDRDKLIKRVFEKLIPDLARNGEFDRIKSLYQFMPPSLVYSYEKEIKNIRPKKNKI